MSFPKEVVKAVTGFAFNATECENQCRERCAMVEEEARQHQRIAINLRDDLHIERIIVRGLDNSIDSLHLALEKEKKAHAQTKRVSTRKINTLKRKLDEISA